MKILIPNSYSALLLDYEPSLLEALIKGQKVSASFSYDGTLRRVSQLENAKDGCVGVMVISDDSVSEAESAEEKA